MTLIANLMGVALVLAFVIVVSVPDHGDGAPVDRPEQR